MVCPCATLNKITWICSYQSMVDLVVRDYCNIHVTESGKTTVSHSLEVFVIDSSGSLYYELMALKLEARADQEN